VAGGYLLIPTAGAGFNVPGAVRAALGARSGIAAGAWCMVTMIAWAGFIPAH
jgi:hypothetical protein